MNTNLLLATTMLSLVGCAVEPDTTDDAPLIDDGGGKADETAGPRSINCYATTAGHALTKVVVTPHGATFDLAASTASGSVFALTSQRPSLQVRVADGNSNAVD